MEILRRSDETRANQDGLVDNSAASVFMRLGLFSRLSVSRFAAIRLEILVEQSKLGDECSPESFKGFVTPNRFCFDSFHYKLHSKIKGEIEAEFRQRVTGYLLFPMRTKTYGDHRTVSTPAEIRPLQLPGFYLSQCG